MQWPFASWGADAVIGAHDHTYERVTADGIPYFVNGLGGRSIYSFGTPISGSQVRYNGDYGAMRVTADVDQMTFEFVNLSGTVIDSFTIQDGTTPPPPPSGTLDIRVASGNDDVEEALLNGSMYFDSTDIELGDDLAFNGEQTVGLRFQNLNIPQGATIDAAYLEFTVDATGSIATDVVIQADAADHAPAFSATPYDLTDRPLTAASMPWSIPAWNNVGATQQSPDISVVLQEVIDRSGWSPNNSVAFVISGTGTREAESYEGAPAAAALLHVEYSSDSGGNLPPSPNPMSWATQPYMNLTWPADNVGTMVATTASDPDGGIEYFFDCVEAPEGGYWNGCEDSGWQASSTFSDWYLQAGNTYHFRVKARDALGNETGWSPQASLTVEGTNPSGQTFANTSSVAISSSGTPTITSDIVVSGMSGVVADVDVALDITHTWDEDLDVTLIAPDGTRIDLFSDIGGNADNFTGTILDDEAATAINTASAPFTGRFRPENDALSLLDGKNPNGTWTLEIFDDANNDGGSLDQWSIALETSAGNQVPTAAFGFTTSDLTASFTDTSTDNDGSIVSWDWDFGDGNSSTAQNPTYTYATDGVYTVSLTVEDDQGAIDTITKDVVVGSVTLPNEIMTWVPSYGHEESQLMAAADFGACSPKDGLTRVGLQFWEVNSDGTIAYEQRSYLDLSDSDVAWWTAWGQANDIDILLTVHNHDGNDWNWDLAYSAFGNNRTTLVNALVAEVERLGLDGVDVDFEGIGNLEYSRDEFAQFIQELSAELKARGKVLTIDSFRYIWNAPNVNWRSDWVGYIDNIHAMGYEDLYEGSTVNFNGDYYDRYSYHQNAGVAAGYAGNDTLMGFPGNFSSWGTSTGYGTSASAHLQEVINLAHGPTGIAIWDFQLPDTGWHDSDLWCEIVALKGESPPVNVDPTASFTHSETDLDASFTDTSTDSDGTIESWSWDFGDGSSSSAQDPVHSYGASGDYTVALTVTDDDGATDTDTVSITVNAPAPNVAPTANAGPNQTVPDSNSAAGENVTLNGSASSDDGIIVSYDWTWPGGSTSGVNPTPSVTLPDGPTEVTLTVTDDDGATDTDTVSITVAAPLPNQDPTANFTSSTSDLTANFTDASTDDDGTIASRLWDFGDGNTSTEQNPSHTYAAANTYTVTLTVTDDDSGTDSISQSITVPVDTTPPAITAPADVTVEATGPTTPVSLGSPVVTDDMDLNPAVTNDAPTGFEVGQTIVTWTATDASGNSSTATQTVTVTDTTAPSITAPANIIDMEATGATTAVALGTATANDLVDGALVPTPDNAGPYPVGVTVVTWTATDASNNPAMATQTVTIVDTTVPTIAAPSDITVESSEPTAVALGTPLVSDLADPTPTVTNDALVLFPVGTTTVTWTATDASGNSATATQTVTVTAPAPQPPAAPSNLTAELQSTGKGKKRVVTAVTLNWSDNSSNEDEFVIERCEETGKGKNKSCEYDPDNPLATVGTGTTSYIVTDLGDVTGTFKYRVKAVNGNGDSGYSNEVKI